MRFIGSKASLVKEIGDYVTANVEGGYTFGDFFCGTAVVSAYFKKLGYLVIANDSLYFCSIFAKSVLFNNSEPTFLGLVNSGELAGTKPTTLSSNPYDFVLSYLNHLPSKKGFFYEEYSPAGTDSKDYQRLYFTDENAQKIDAMREKIAVWSEDSIITEAEEALLLSDLIKAANGVANIAGTYGFFLKDFADPRVRNPLLLTRSEIIGGNGEKHRVYQEDANILAKKIGCDVLYLDPPYTWRHYGAYYHIPETIARWDKPKVKGKSGLRPWEDTRSRYSLRDEALKAFIELVENAQSKHIFISYNSEGLVSHEDLLKNLATVGEVNFKEFKHQRYKSNNGGSGNTKVMERLYYVKKEI